MRNSLVVSALLAALTVAQPVQAQPTDTQYEVSVSKYLMGTQVEATVRHTDITAAKSALVEAFKEMERVEGVLSEHKNGSEISRVNREAGTRPVHVSMETFEILTRAKKYAERLGGLFDVSIGPLTELWGFNGDDEISLPSADRIAALRSLVDYRKITLNEADTTVFLPSKGMSLDLGGIAKGYAIDRGVAVLRRKGIRHFVLNAGGDVYAAGVKDADHDWRIGIRHPREPDGLIARFELKDYAAATSGDYQRFAILDGKRYHHILDPRTGYPATQSQSATALASTAEEADVLATFVFIQGAEALATRGYEEAYLVVDAEGGVHPSPAFERSKELGLEML